MTESSRVRSRSSVPKKVSKMGKGSATPVVSITKVVDIFASFEHVVDRLY